MQRKGWDEDLTEAIGGLLAELAEQNGGSPRPLFAAPGGNNGVGLPIGSILEGAGMSAGKLSLGALAAVFGLAAPAAAADVAPPPHDAPAFERHKDIAYLTGPGADPERHRLDVFCPKGKKNFPVVMFVHGG